MPPRRRRHQARRRLALQHDPKLLGVAPAATPTRLHDLTAIEGTVLIDVHTRSLLPLRASWKAVQAGCVRIAQRGVESSQKLGRHRWVVERTFAWLAQFRRLDVRYKRRADVHIAFSKLACAIIDRLIDLACYAA